jgi:glycosyltransferase involved in cell wall biosynthesis
MTRVALLSSEPVRPLMAGIGIRYLQFAHYLPEQDLDVVLLTPAEPAESALLLRPGTLVRRFERGRLAELTADCDVAVAQGQLANDLLLEVPRLPTAIDLYDPWLVENCAYAETLGLAPYRNDHATWVLQMSRGDFFLCSSEEQRGFYFGFLAALGRVNPEILARDPDLASLIAPVPFAVPAELPPHRPLLPPRAPGERRLLFGGLYDWYDPWTLLAALERLALPGWTLLLIRNPNPESTPQKLFGEVEAHCRRLGWWGSRVQALDWVPAERRYDLLRDVDLLVAPHRPSLETRLSLRTRFLDALAAGCPVITSEGGAIARLLAEHRAGWVVPPGNPEALAGALSTALSEPAGATELRLKGARALLAAFRTERAFAPLLRFCQAAQPDASRERFVFRPETVARDRLLPRVRRRLRRMRQGG